MQRSSKLAQRASWWIAVILTLCVLFGMAAPHAHADDQTIDNNESDSSSSEFLGPSIEPADTVMEQRYPNSITTGDGIGTISVHYYNHYNKKALTGTTMSLYHIADWSGDGKYVPVDPFSDEQQFPITTGSEFWGSAILGASQNELRELATTFATYIAANNVSTQWKASIGGDGVAKFTQVPNGLYVITADAFNTDVLACDQAALLVSVPSTAKGYTQSVDLAPKTTCVVNPKYRDPLTVRKVWNDGNAADRPTSVTVRLMLAGKVYDTQELNAGNDWAFTWHQLEMGENWYVAEVDVPQGYTVGIDYDRINAETEYVTITNTKPGTGTTVPGTSAEVPPAGTSSGWRPWIGQTAQTGAEITTICVVLVASAALGCLLIVKSRRDAKASSSKARK